MIEIVRNGTDVKREKTNCGRGEEQREKGRREGEKGRYKTIGRERFLLSKCVSKRQVRTSCGPQITLT